MEISDKIIQKVIKTFFRQSDWYMVTDKSMKDFIRIKLWTTLECCYNESEISSMPLEQCEIFKNAIFKKYLDIKQGEKYDEHLKELRTLYLKTEKILALVLENGKLM